MEAFASLSRKAAGSQGRALSRAPQSAKFPLIFPIPREGKSTKIKNKSASRRMRNSLERPSDRTAFPFCLFWLIPGLDTGNQKGDFARCTHFIRAQRGNKDSDLRADGRLEALPQDSASLSRKACAKASIGVRCKVHLRYTYTTFLSSVRSSISLCFTIYGKSESRNFFGSLTSMPLRENG